jgi:hypothetical protein
MPKEFFIQPKKILAENRKIGDKEVDWGPDFHGSSPIRRLERLRRQPLIKHDALDGFGRSSTLSRCHQGP